MSRLSKHERIMKYLYSLEEGAKISVRQISSHLDVSEGTSYRAIKQAEKEGIVKTIPRVGSIRITKREVENIEELTFEQIQHIINGQVISGGEQLDKTVGRIIIGAMEIDALTEYLEAGALLIIGNREDAQKAALDFNTGLLITGGFGMSPEILERARELNLPVISTPFDTFTVATTIHREIYSLSLSNEMIRAADFVIKEHAYVLDLSKNRVGYLPSDKITILVDKNRYLGTVKSSELHIVDESNFKNFIIDDIELAPNTTLQRMRQLMTWEQLNILPVVEDGYFVGVVHRRDVFKEMVPKKLFGEDLSENIIERRIDLSENQLTVEVMPLMTDEFGSLKESSFMSLVEKLVRTVLQSYNIYSYHIDSYHVTQMKIVQLHQQITLNGEIMDMGHQFLRLEVATVSDGVVYSKALLQVQIYEHK